MVPRQDVRATTLLAELVKPHTRYSENPTASRPPLRVHYDKNPGSCVLRFHTRKSTCWNKKQTIIQFLRHCQKMFSNLSFQPHILSRIIAVFAGHLVWNVGSTSVFKTNNLYRRYRRAQLDVFLIKMYMRARRAFITLRNRLKYLESIFSLNTWNYRRSAASTRKKLYTTNWRKTRLYDLQKQTHTNTHRISIQLADKFYS